MIYRDSIREAIRKKTELISPVFIMFSEIHNYLAASKPALSAFMLASTIA